MCEKWERSNHMTLMVISFTIQESVRDIIVTSLRWVYKNFKKEALDE